MPYNTKEKRKEYQKTRNLRRRYGLTREAYELMLKAQKGKCKLCPYKPTDKHRALGVDHSHIDGLIRGLLCSYCNRKIIGAIEKIGLSKIAKYLGYRIIKI